MKISRFTSLLSLIALLATVCNHSVAAPIDIQVVPSSAPNFFGSSSWSGYLANANNSLENTTGANIGNRSTDPTAYEAFADGQNIAPGDILVTGFNSWRGDASAAAPFGNEYGNRVHFGVHITGDGVTQFSGADIDGEITSSDGNVLGVSSAVTSGSYTSTRIGINWGADRIRGNGDDTRFTSGLDTQLIDEFVYVGFGNAYDASFESGPSDQEKIDQTIASISPNLPITVTGSYTVFDSARTTVLGTGSSSVNVVPEPTSLALAGLGLCGLATIRRRRQA